MIEEINTKKFQTHLGLCVYFSLRSKVCDYQNLPFDPRNIRKCSFVSMSSPKTFKFSYFLKICNISAATENKNLVDSNLKLAQHF